MRALDQEEYDMLRGQLVVEFASPDRARHMAISDRLLARGCVTRSVTPDGWIVYAKTHLGHLALRVSKPERAFTI